MLGGEYLGDAFWWCFAWTAHCIRTLNTLMPLLEKKDLISTISWFCLWTPYPLSYWWHPAGTCEPASMTLLWPTETYRLLPTCLKWLKKMLHKKALTVWTKMLSIHMHHCHLLTQSISIYSIVQPLKTIFSYPLGLKVVTEGSNYRTVYAQWRRKIFSCLVFQTPTDNICLSAVQPCFF